MKNNVKSLIKIIKELGFILDKQQKKKFFLVMFIILLGSAFELIGVSAILPFIQVLTTPDVLKENPLISPILNILHIQNSNDLLILTGIGLNKNIVLISSVPLASTSLFLQSWQKECASCQIVKVDP